MGKPFEVEFTGSENLVEIFNKLPQQYAKKPLVATFRKAARPLAAAIKAGVPTRSGATRKAVAVRASRGTGITVGFHAKGGKMPEYMKAYWLNYGTLDNRSQSHPFKRPRKKQTRNRRGGIKAMMFIESAWNQTQDQVQSIINTDLEQKTVEFLKKYSV